MPYIHHVLTPYIGGDVGTGEYAQTFRCPSRLSQGDPPSFSGPNPIDNLTNEIHTHYRYNWQAAFYRHTLLTLQKTSSAEPFVSLRTDSVLSSSDALLIYDTVFPDWAEEEFPHKGGGGRAINTAYVDGHTDTLGFEDYIEGTDDLPLADFANPLYAEGWPYPESPF